MLAAVLTQARRAGATLDLAPGLVLVALLTAIAYALASLAHVPTVFLAVLLGIACARFNHSPMTETGVGFCARPLLRFGIVLMGVRLSLHDMAVLGAPAAGIAIGSVIVTLVGGSMIGRLFGLSRDRAILSAGAVGICGASAALAISGALPGSRARQSETIQTIALVTCLSTVVMIAYPLAARWIGLSDIAAGILFGASIHDMTQVLGAGAMISPDAATAATATKLVRIACLAPAVVAIGLVVRTRAASGGNEVPLLPRFLIGFVLMALATNAGLIGVEIATLLSEFASISLVAASAALGLKTSLGHLRADGWRSVAAMTAQTLLIGAYALAAVTILNP